MQKKKIRVPVYDFKTEMRPKTASKTVATPINGYLKFSTVEMDPREFMYNRYHQSLMGYALRETLRNMTFKSSYKISLVGTHLRERQSVPYWVMDLSVSVLFLDPRDATLFKLTWEDPEQ